MTLSSTFSARCVTVCYLAWGACRRLPLRSQACLSGCGSHTWRKTWSSLPSSNSNSSCQAHSSCSCPLRKFGFPPSAPHKFTVPEIDGKCVTPPPPPSPLKSDSLQNHSSKWSDFAQPSFPAGRTDQYDNLLDVLPFLRTIDELRRRPSCYYYN